MFPLVAFERIDDGLADARLIEWGHWLGGCNRPCGGRQSFGLFLEGDLISVAVSAMTIGPRSAERDRRTVVELARLCSDPAHRDMTRVAIRLWRKCAASAWSSKYWPVEAYISYANRNRHTGDVYRFDGWQRWGNTRSGSVGKNARWSEPGLKIEPKSIWVFPLEADAG